MGLWGVDKPEQKRQQGSGGIGWLRSPDGDKVICIEGAGESLHAKWVDVTDADITSSGRPRGLATATATGPGCLPPKSVTSIYGSRNSARAASCPRSSNPAGGWIRPSTPW